MEKNLLALVLANWSALQVCLSIKGKIEDIQYILFGIRNNSIIPTGEIRQIIINSHLKGYNVALVLVLFITGSILMAAARYANLEGSEPIFLLMGIVYLIAAVSTAIFQAFDYRNVKNILRKIDSGE